MNLDILVEHCIVDGSTRAFHVNQFALFTLRKKVFGIEVLFMTFVLKTR